MDMTMLCNLFPCVTGKPRQQEVTERLFFYWTDVSALKLLAQSLRSLLISFSCCASLQMASDTEIGHARVPLTAIYSKATEELRIPLVSPKGKTAGELQLLLTFKPYAQPAAQQHMAPQPVMQAAAMYAQAAAPIYAQPPAPMYAAAPAVPAYVPAPVQPAPMYTMQYAAAPAGYPAGVCCACCLAGDARQGALFSRRAMQRDCGVI